MKNKKTLIIGAISIITVSIVACFAIVFSNRMKIFEKNNADAFADLPKTRYNIDRIYKANFSNPEIVMDCYPYAFIAKVNKIIKTDYRDPSEIELTPDGSQMKKVYKPYTIYDITVIENLKGKIVKNTNIPIEQVGGILKDQDAVIFPRGMDFLKENYYYILLPYADDNTKELVLEASHNVIELGDLADNDIKDKVLNIARISKITDIETSLNNYEVFNQINSSPKNDSNIQDINEIYANGMNLEKINQNEITKILSYKYVSMTPVDLKYYENLASSQGLVADYKTFYFATNMSKYDVNYKE